MFKVDLEKGKGSVVISGKVSEVMGNLTTLLHKVYISGDGDITKDMLYRAVDMAVKSEEELEKDLSNNQDSLKKELKKFSDELKGVFENQDNSNKINKLVDEVVDAILDDDMFK